MRDPSWTPTTRHCIQSNSWPKAAVSASVSVYLCPIYVICSVLRHHWWSSSIYLSSVLTSSHHTFRLSSTSLSSCLHFLAVDRLLHTCTSEGSKADDDNKPHFSSCRSRSRSYTVCQSFRLAFGLSLLSSLLPSRCLLTVFFLALLFGKSYSHHSLFFIGRLIFTHTKVQQNGSRVSGLRAESQMEWNFHRESFHFCFVLLDSQTDILISYLNWAEHLHDGGEI